MVLDQLEYPDCPEHVGNRDDTVACEQVILPPEVRVDETKDGIDQHGHHRHQIDDIEELGEETQLAWPHYKLEQ